MAINADNDQAYYLAQKSEVSKYGSILKWFVNNNNLIELVFLKQ